VRHDSTQTGWGLHPSEPGNAFQEVISGEPDLLVTKHVNSAFIGEPALEPWLRERGHRRDRRRRHPDQHVLRDDRADGRQPRLRRGLRARTRPTPSTCPTPSAAGRIDADTLARVTAANLHDEFAQVMSTDELIAGS
jgi:hypothetical protein